MAPSAELVRRTSSAQGGQIALAVAIGVAAALLLGILIVSIILFRRRRRAATQYHPSPAERAHKVNLSDASVDPLLIKAIKNDGALREKASLPTLRSADEITRYNRNSLSINTTGLYHLPSAETLSPTAALSPAASSSFCLPHNPDTRSFNDQQHQPPSMQRPPLPPLPPLVIPSGQSTNSYSNVAALVEEPPSPSRPPSSCPSSSSLYSQPTAESPPTTPPATYLHLPLSQELTYETAPEEAGFQRDDTYLVGNLLKARAQRNPAGLVRASSQVSHIERMGSIRSVGPLREDDRPFARRYRSKKRKVRRDSGMEVVNEVLPEDTSFRGRSNSPASHYNTTPLIKPPSPVISFPQSPLLRKP